MPAYQRDLDSDFPQLVADSPIPPAEPPAEPQGSRPQGKAAGKQRKPADKQKG